MLITSSSNALGQTLALLVTFGGIGVIVTLLLLYIFAQIFAEHRENQEHDPGIG